MSLLRLDDPALVVTGVTSQATYTSQQMSALNRVIETFRRKEWPIVYMISTEAQPHPEMLYSAPTDAVRTFEDWDRLGQTLDANPSRPPSCRTGQIAFLDAVVAGSGDTDIEQTLRAQKNRGCKSWLVWDACAHSYNGALHGARIKRSTDAFE